MALPQTIQMANLGMADSLILMVMALVVFGPRRLPQIGRQIGKLMYEFRKASNDFKFQMEEELRLSEDADRRKKEEEERQKTYALAAPKPEGTALATAQENAPASPAIEYTSGYTSESMIQPPPLSSAEDTASHAEVPRILPPSSGEQVHAERPNRAYIPPQPSLPPPSSETGANPDDAASEVAAAFVAQAGIEADTAPADAASLEGSSEPSHPAEPEQAAHHA
jgi:sec-independent protein translocase protein TatB